jgi:hypothetical protein
MDGRGARARLRSFAVGGLVGASAALAAARRRRLRREARRTPLGLAAFEQAPCYREVLELESQEDVRAAQRHAAR